MITNSSSNFTCHVRGGGGFNIKIDRSSQRQEEFKRQLIWFMYVNLVFSYSWNDFSLAKTGRVWKSQSKARRIHYGSKQKKTAYSQILFPRKPGEKVLESSVSLLHVNFSVLLFNSMRVIRPKSVIVFSIWYTLNVSYISFLLVTFLFVSANSLNHYVEFNFPEKIKSERFQSSQADLLYYYFMSFGRRVPWLLHL